MSVPIYMFLSLVGDVVGGMIVHQNNMLSIFD